MYQVFDNNRPADNKSFPKLGNAWKKSKFKSFIAAHNYAQKWMGALGSPSSLKLNTPYDYSGYGDMIEIRKV